MKTVYVVMCCYGDYESYHEEPVMVFDNKDDAEKYAKEQHAKDEKTYYEVQEVQKGD